MENQIVNLLILEDNERHFDIIKNFFDNKINFFDNFELKICDKLDSHNLITDYIGYKNIGSNFVAKVRPRLQKNFDFIMSQFEVDSVICIIDINWEGNKNGGSIEMDEDLFGLDFHKDFLVFSDKFKDAIVTTVGDVNVLKSKLKGYGHIISKKDDNNKYLTDLVLNKYLEEIKKILELPTEDGDIFDADLTSKDLDKLK